MDEWKISVRCYALSFAMAFLPMARQLQRRKTIGFRRLWITGLLGAWLSIFSGNALAWCESNEASPPVWTCRAPSVSITSPVNGATYTVPVSISVTATVSNTGQPITQVDFYVNNTFFQTVTTAPYSVTYTPPVPGTYTFKAIATEINRGTRTGTSSLVSVTAISPTNTPPAVSITAPTNSAIYTAPANVSLSASASDSDGTVAKVDFFDGGTLVGTATAAPYGVALANLPAGTHTFTARATDNQGVSATSAAVSISVDTPPTVTITSPANNTVFTAPANITVNATAGDADGSVAKVDFFDGTTLVGTATAAPFSMTLANVSPGAHTLTARATDNLGLSVTSAAVSIQVDAPPVVVNTSSVGATAGTFSVDQNGGAGYTIPISVSPGTAGMEPRVALSYSRQIQSDLLGVGWSVGGLSIIHRCGTTIVLDGLKGGVNYDANDRFCLDGQRLILISGVYGADGAQYRTERESFSKIV